MSPAPIRIPGLAYESGSFDNQYEYIRFGRGKEKLVVFPTLNDGLWPPPTALGYIQSVLYFMGFTRDFTIYVIGRKRKLSVGYSTRDMALDYAGVFKNHLGRCHIMGMSLGGMIAQHFAYDYPQYVKKLVLVASAYRMGDEGLKIARRWIPWAKIGMWKEIYEDTVEMSFTGARGFTYEAVKYFILKFLKKTVKDPADFIISGQAGILHDSGEILSKIRVPVLMIGGTEDSFFPENLFYEMDERIPDSKLVIFKKAKHGVYEENLKRCNQLIRDWLINGDSAVQGETNHSSLPEAGRIPIAG